MIEEVPVAGINNYIFRTFDQVGVTIVNADILPDKGMNSICYFHESYRSFSS